MDERVKAKIRMTTLPKPLGTAMVSNRDEAEEACKRLADERGMPVNSVSYEFHEDSESSWFCGACGDVISKDSVYFDSRGRELCHKCHWSCMSEERDE